jgi:hypothetical protein
VTIAVTPGYKKCHSRKPQQLLELATFVAARRMGVTLDDVSERFGSSRRTAQRIMHALEAQLKERKDAGDEATIRRLRELEEIATAAASTKQEPVRLNLVQPSEYGLFTILRAQAPAADEGYLADCARRMVGHLRANQLLSPGWSNSIGGRMRVEQSLLAESWNDRYAKLGFDPDARDPPFLKPAVSERSKSDGVSRDDAGR